MHYRREIDGLRAVAVVPVILFHAGFTMFSGGYVGVDVFFVISGYLITSIIINDLRNDRFSIVRFYERRARRILPALFLVILVCLPLAWIWLLAANMREFSRSLIAVGLFSSNVLFWREIGYFDTAAELKPLLHTWSLAVEEQFYLFFPPLLALLWRRRPGWIVPALFGVAVLSVALSQWAVHRQPDANFFLLPTRAWELMIGALVAWRLEHAQALAPTQSRWAPGAAALGLAMIVVSVFAYDHDTPFPSLYALLPTIGTALVILYARPDRGAGRLLSLPAIVGIGLISYSAYLWHQPLFALVTVRDIERPGPLVYGGLCLLTLVLAWFSWRYVERPFRTPGVLSRRVVFAFSGAGTAILIAVGAAGLATNGFIQRFAPADRYLASLSKGDMGDYVQAQFDKARLHPFDPADPRRKVLLVGDSYSQDLANAIHESGLSKRLQLATHFISARCGNLYLQTDFLDRIEEPDRPTCKIEGWYEDPQVQALLRDADEIWLASSWREWQVELLPQSLTNLERDFGKQAVVFGRKNFGAINVRRLLATPGPARISIENPMTEQHLETNELMERTVPPGQFVNLSALMCGQGDGCRIFDDSGELLSHDGGHLTRAGAAEMGQRLEHFRIPASTVLGAAATETPASR